MAWNIIRCHRKSSNGNLLSRKRWWERCFLVASDGIHKYSNCGQRCLTVTNHDLVILTMSDHYWSQLTTKWKTSLRIAAFISFIVFSSGRNFIFSLVGSIRSKRFKPWKPFETFEYSSIIWVVLVFLNFLVRGRSVVGQLSVSGSLAPWLPGKRCCMSFFGLRVFWRHCQHKNRCQNISFDKIHKIWNRRSF